MNRILSELRKQNKICEMDREFIFNMACRVFIRKSDENSKGFPVVITTKKQTCLTKLMQKEKMKLKCISNVCRKYSDMSFICIITIIEDGSCVFSVFENPNSLATLYK